ncbi:NTP transferase domain-containing protein [Pararhizobium sp. LjRoot238]|uniref:NTP transferase domain-containing protein n=1 Tax=Pararhizobium sp. LjRoot238 TaxID=3342293 RepID=UPI003ECCA758
MKFGTYPVEEAQGLVLAHSVKLPEGTLSKGHAVTAGDISHLKAAGVDRVVAVMIEGGDLSENEAARRLSQTIAPRHLRFSQATTGRVNVYATSPGLFVVDKAVVDRVNRIDSAITLACLADHTTVSAGDMVGTIKIIPLAVPGLAIEAACSALRAAPVFGIKPFSKFSVSLISTELPSLKVSVMDKTKRVLERRLAVSGNGIVREQRVAHECLALSRSLQDVISAPDEAPKLVIIFGASAVADIADVIPEAIRAVGGEVVAVGMPVDPGNLLVLGRVGQAYVIGAPGCARSPKENGFDWVLDRIVAGEMPDAHDLAGMGVGGLLTEINMRPHLRDGPDMPSTTASVAIVVLAAGRSSRMGEGGSQKLLAEFDGLPLVRRSAQTALESNALSVTVVTGHRRAEIEQVLSGLSVSTIENPNYASGMASSLITGISVGAVRHADGILIMIADMPGVSTEDLNILIAAFHESGARAIVRAVSRGKRGNPVILPRSLKAAILRLEGDIGARHIIETAGAPIIDVEIGDAAHLDVDTPEAVIAAGGVLRN